MSKEEFKQRAEELASFANLDPENRLSFNSTCWAIIEDAAYQRRFFSSWYSKLLRTASR